MAGEIRSLTQNVHISREWKVTVQESAEGNWVEIDLGIHPNVQVNYFFDPAEGDAPRKRFITKLHKELGKVIETWNESDKNVQKGNEHE